MLMNYCIVCIPHYELHEERTLFAYHSDYAQEILHKCLSREWMYLLGTVTWGLSLYSLESRD